MGWGSGTLKCVLTKYRHDDNTEIEDVPRLFEVVQSQAEQFHDALDDDETGPSSSIKPSDPLTEFHDALEGKDCDEELVDEVEDDGQLLRLVVMFHCHCRHVQ